MLDVNEVKLIDLNVTEAKERKPGEIQARVMGADGKLHEVVVRLNPQSMAVVLKAILGLDEFFLTSPQAQTVLGISYPTLVQRLNCYGHGRSNYFEIGEVLAKRCGQEIVIQGAE